LTELVKKLDLWYSNAAIVLHPVQNDAGSRFLAASITDCGKPYTIPEQATVMLAVKKPDGTSTLTSATVTDNKVIAELTNQTLAVKGIADAQIIIYSGLSELKTPPFKLNISEQIIPDGVVESTDEWSALVTLLNQYSIDTQLDSTSTHAVENRVVAAALDTKLPAADGSVTTSKIADEAISLDKLAAAVAALIESALQTSGGTMSGNIDMDGNRIKNLPAPGANNDPARKKDVTDLSALCEKLANKVTSIDSQSTDDEYPSAKCVKDLADTITAKTITTISDTQYALDLGVGVYQVVPGGKIKLYTEQIPYSQRYDLNAGFLVFTSNGNGFVCGEINSYSNSGDAENYDNRIILITYSGSTFEIIDVFETLSENFQAIEDNKTDDIIGWASNSEKYPSTKGVYDTCELKTNKVTSVSGNSTDNQYPSAKCLNDRLALKEDKSNKVTSIDQRSTDDQYPSAKCVYDAIGGNYKLVREITADGTQNSYTITIDNAQSCYIACSFPVGSATTNFRQTFYCGSVAIANYLHGQINNAQARYHSARCQLEHGLWFISGRVAAANDGDQNCMAMAPCPPKTKADCAYIDSITIQAVTASVMIPSGSKIYVYAY